MGFMPRGATENIPVDYDKIGKLQFVYLVEKKIFGLPDQERMVPSAAPRAHFL